MNLFFNLFILFIFIVGFWKFFVLYPTLLLGILVALLVVIFLTKKAKRR